MTDRTTIIALAQMLCYSGGDETEMTRIFDELMIELSHDSRAWFVNVASFDIGAFPLALNVVQLLAAFYEGRQLSRESLQHLDAARPGWRNLVGAPLAYVTEDQDDRQLLLVPQAVAPPPDAMTIIYTESRTSLIPDVLSLPLAWLVLGREFARESPHRDAAFAEVATALGHHLLDYIA